MRALIGQLRHWAQSLKTHIHALYLASRDNRVPLLAKLIIGMVVAYALSPIDLIPDFIPLLGYLDDLLLLPLGMWLAIRLIPPVLWQENLVAAQAMTTRPPRNRTAAILIVLLWLVAFVALLWWAWPLMHGINRG